MKRTKNIYPQIIAIENILAAIAKGAVGKRNRPEVRRVAENPLPYAQKIHKMLTEKTYVPCAYRESTIREGSGQKRRKVAKIKFFPDQIIHWAVIRQIQPIFIRSAYVYSCGSMPGRGIHYGKKAIERWLTKDRKNTKYVAKLDIAKFYPSVCHDVVKQRLSTVIKDKDATALLHQIIDSYPAGLPIGYLTSQWLANFTLQPIDYTIKQTLKIKYYVRYMDDMILFGPNKKKLHVAVRFVAAELAKVGLTLKRNWQVFKPDCRPLDFMGFRFYRDKTTLRKSLMLRITRKARKISKKSTVRLIDAAAMLSYFGWIGHTQTRKVYENHIKPFVNVGKMKRIVSRHAKAAVLARQKGDGNGSQAIIERHQA